MGRNRTFFTCTYQASQQKQGTSNINLVLTNSAKKKNNKQHKTKYKKPTNLIMQTLWQAVVCKEDTVFPARKSIQSVHLISPILVKQNISYPEALATQMYESGGWGGTKKEVQRKIPTKIIKHSEFISNIFKEK